MSKFYVVLRTTRAGLPQNVKIETTADSEGLARSHALYHLRKHGHSAFKVTPKVFAPHLQKFKQAMDVAADKSEVVMMCDPNDEIWRRALDLRHYIPQVNRRQA